MIVGFVALPIALTFMLVGAVRTLLAGGVPEMVAWVPVYFVVFATILIARAIRPQSWLLVPAGIVVRESSWRSSAWRLHLIRRADGVLFYWRDINMLAIASADGTAFSRFATPREATLAMRAWQSPLDPPDLDRLSDLR